ncbi:hypothetical protein [Rhodococcus chondri]|uniref:Uncharacterized protein n=1 Tax=Rhodococcus chondri TaxID=3065941 RepID=A0ABU7JV80_9NOCA|nr:hypothetical protein [Rhodococcus sp. CC-R104]MEE2033928.1 hypothetical protein [Rhodococcus sp. CC-R104]
MFGDLGVGELRELPQHDGGAVVLGKFGERAPHRVDIDDRVGDGRAGTGCAVATTAPIGSSSADGSATCRPALVTQSASSLRSMGTLRSANSNSAEPGGCRSSGGTNRTAAEVVTSTAVGEASISPISALTRALLPRSISPTTTTVRRSVPAADEALARARSAVLFSP